MINVISGVTIVGCGEVIERESEKTVVELFAEAMRQALNLSGVLKTEIDGFITTMTIEYPPIPGWLPDQLCRYLGLEPRFSEILNMGGTSFEGFIVRTISRLGSRILCEYYAWWSFLLTTNSTRCLNIFSRRFRLTSDKHHAQSSDIDTNRNHISTR